MTVTTFDPDSVLDHMVVNVRFDMDDAAKTFSDVGFTLTDRGYHTLGSMNHLMILGSDYLELIGVTPENASRRREVAEAPIGLNGLVFKSDDVDATYAHLRAIGMAGDAPKSFSRPLEVGGEQHEARFRTVAVRSGTFSAGRVYFCEHLTPELVWRDEWRAHANGAAATTRFIVVARDVGECADRFARLLQRSVDQGSQEEARIALGASELAIVSSANYRARFGELALSIGGGDSTFGAIALRSASLVDVEAAVANAGSRCHTRRHADSLQVLIERYQTLLEFVG